MKFIVGMLYFLTASFSVAETRLDQCINIHQFAQFEYKCRLYDSASDPTPIDFTVVGGGRALSDSIEYVLFVAIAKVHQNLPAPSSPEEMLKQIDLVAPGKGFKLGQMIQPLWVKQGSQPSQCLIDPQTGLQRVSQYELRLGDQNTTYWMARTIFFHPQTYELTVSYGSSNFGRGLFVCRPERESPLTTSILQYPQVQDKLPLVEELFPEIEPLPLTDLMPAGEAPLPAHSVLVQQESAVSQDTLSQTQPEKRARPTQRKVRKHKGSPQDKYEFFDVIFVKGEPAIYKDNVLQKRRTPTVLRPNSRDLNSEEEDFLATGSNEGADLCDQCPQRKKTLFFNCQQCGTKETVQLRNGPLGPGTLCNACGLKWAKKKRAAQDPIARSLSSP